MAGGKRGMTQNQMFAIVRRQLAVDLNCSPGDFDRDGIVFCQAKDNPGRRPFPREERHFEMVTMGGAVIVTATPDILPYIKEQLQGKTRDDAFAASFVHGQGVNFLPDKPQPLPLPDGFEFSFFQKEDIPGLYAHDGFRNAVQYDVNHPRPDVIAMTAKRDGVIAGMSGCSADCGMIWQIGIDVKPGYRGHGLAAALTNRLAIEIINRGKIPHYHTATSNIASQRTAYRAGFRPAWTCVWKGVFDGILTGATS
jgi:GNAT superfamily N-acetyltransferase